VTFYGDAIVVLGFYQSFPGLDHRVPRESMPLLLYSSRDITSKNKLQRPSVFPNGQRDEFW